MGNSSSQVNSCSYSSNIFSLIEVYLSVTKGYTKENLLVNLICPLKIFVLSKFLSAQNFDWNIFSFAARKPITKNYQIFEGKKYFWLQSAKPEINFIILIYWVNRIATSNQLHVFYGTTNNPAWKLTSELQYTYRYQILYVDHLYHVVPMSMMVVTCSASD